MSRTDAGAAPATTRTHDAVAISPTMRAATYSVVIPVFNSAAIVGTTIDRTVGFFRDAGLDVEVICVNDGSRDGSWSVIAAKAEEHAEVVAIDLLRNYGQHNANLCGLRAAAGDWVVTIDDDLQNPPEEIVHLLAAAGDGEHDVVYGRFVRKQAARHRGWGSTVIGLINRRIFGQPRDLAVTNFRLVRRDVVDRICADRSAFPYITGLSLWYSNNPANATVVHDLRAQGKSTYNLLRISRLVVTILFSYSAFPLRLSAVLGSIVAVIAFLTGGVYLVLGLTGRTQVEGWTTLVVLLAFFNGVTVLMLSMLGEYLVRTLNQTSAREAYHVARTVGRDG